MVPNYITEFSQELIEIICISGQQPFSVKGQVAIETIWSLLQLFSAATVEEKLPQTVYKQMSVALLQENFIYKMGCSFPPLDQCNLNNA